MFPSKLWLFVSFLWILNISIAFDMDICESSLKTYDFNHDGYIDFDEFRSLYMSLFTKTEQRFITNPMIEKMFHYLDITEDNKLSNDEYCKLFYKWLVPFMSPKPSLFACVAENFNPNVWNIQNLLQPSFNLFNVTHIYLADCSRNEPDWHQLAEVKNSIERLYPQSQVHYYSYEGHRDSSQNKSK